MKYEAPELTALTNAINAVQGTLDSKPDTAVSDSITGDPKEAVSAYADWE